MDPVSKVSQVLALMRSRMAGRSRPSDRLRATAATTASSKPNTDWRAQVATGLSGLDLNDLSARVRARRVIIEGLLVKEFGLDLYLDPQFPELAREIQSLIEESDDLRADVDLLALRLLEAQKNLP